MYSSIAINQPYFFPYIGYFQLISSVDVFLMYDFVGFSKRTWMTRNRLLGFAQDSVSHWTVPVCRAEKLFNVIIDQDNFADWRRHSLTRLHHQYRRAKYFDEIISLLHDMVLLPDDKRLSSLNSNIINKVCKILEVDTTLLVNQIEWPQIEDVCYSFASQTDLDIKTARIIKICELYNVVKYQNLPGGKSIYRTEMFERFGIKIDFIQPVIRPYRQFTDVFHPNLSIIDVLMHCGIDRTKKEVRTSMKV